MKREFLKELELEDGIIDKIMSEYGKSINSYKGDNDTKSAQINELRAELAKYSDYNELKAYKSKYEELQGKYNADLGKAKLDSIITEKLYKSKAKNPDLIKKSINYDKIEIDTDGNYKGIDEQINTLKESDSYLFQSDKDTIPSVSTVGLGNDKNEPTLDAVSQAFYKRNPDLLKEKK